MSAKGAALIGIKLSVIPCLTFGAHLCFQHISRAYARAYYLPRLRRASARSARFRSFGALPRLRRASAPSARALTNLLEYLRASFETVCGEPSSQVLIHYFRNSCPKQDLNPLL